MGNCTSTNKTFNSKPKDVNKDAAGADHGKSERPSTQSMRSSWGLSTSLNQLPGRGKTSKNSSVLSSERSSLASNLTTRTSAAATSLAPAPPKRLSSRRGLSISVNQMLHGGGTSQRMVIITDPGQDLDDEMTFILLRCLQGLGLVDVKCVVTNLHPSFKRALLCRGALDMLGMHEVPVGYGSDGGDTAGVHGDDFRETAPYMPSETSQQAFSLPAGRTLLYRIFSDAMPKSLSICLISSMKDAAGFLRDNEELFIEKVSDVTIMGGVKFPISEGQPMEPDTAHNNEFDRPGAEFLYQRIQELGIQLIVVTRNVAYACPVPRQVYDDLAQSGSPIGWRLRNAQRASIEGLWRRAASADPGIRMGLPARCNAEWFKKTFCGNDPEADDRGANDPIWDLVKSFNMYDSMALIAAIPLLRDHLFLPVNHLYLGVQHMVIGASPEERGTSEEQAKDCVNFLHYAYKAGIFLDHHQKTQVIISMQVQPNTSDTFLGLAVLRTLIAIDIMDCFGIVISSKKTYIDLDELEVQAARIRKLLADLGLQSVKVYTQHTSIRENRLEQLYESAPQTGVKLLIAHSLTDAAVFAMKAPNLFRDKTLSVVLMGGAVQPDATGDMLEPDMDSQKIASDPESAIFLIRRCQEAGVPLTVVSRSISTTCCFPRAAFDAMSRHGGSIGKRCAEEVEHDVNWIHGQVMMDHDDENRELPEKCNQEWFENNFCTGTQPGTLWERISNWRLYTALMILAAVPKITEHFFEMTYWETRGITHNLVGFSKFSSGKSSGIDTDKTQELKQFMFQFIYKGMLMNSSEYEMDKLIEVPDLGPFQSSESIPDWINITHDVHMALQESVENTFLRRVFDCKK